MKYLLAITLATLAAQSSSYQHLEVRKADDSKSYATIRSLDAHWQGWLDGYRYAEWTLNLDAVDPRTRVCFTAGAKTVCALAMDLRDVAEHLTPLKK